MKRNKGLTLVELMLVLSIITVLSSAAFFVYKITSEKQKVSESIDSIISIKKNMHVLSSIETKSENSIKILMDGDNFPPHMRKDEQLLNSWRGKMEIKPRNEQYYNIVFYSIPESSCINLVSNSRSIYTKVENTNGEFVETNDIVKISDFCGNISSNDGIVFSNFYEGEGAFDTSVSTSNSVSLSTSNSVSISNSISASNSISTSNATI